MSASITYPHYEWQDTGDKRSAIRNWVGIGVLFALGLALMLSGCAGKDGTNHPNAADWKAFKDTL